MGMLNFAFLPRACRKCKRQALRHWGFWVNFGPTSVTNYSNSLLLQKKIQLSVFESNLLSVILEDGKVVVSGTFFSAGIVFCVWLAYAKLL